MGEIFAVLSLSDELAKAFAEVPRHVLLPASSIEEVYCDRPVILKSVDIGGVRIPLVTSSQPSLMAKMLMLADLKPASRVLEIGSGSGCNAALIASVAKQGRGASIDLEPDAVRGARQAVASLGYENVRIYEADGWRGYAKNAPYDRIIATANTRDIPWCILTQLSEDGILVAPFSIQYINQKKAIVSFKRYDGLRYKNGAEDRSRTRDPLFTKQPLYH